MPSAGKQTKKEKGKENRARLILLLLLCFSFFFVHRLDIFSFLLHTTVFFAQVMAAETRRTTGSIGVGPDALFCGLTVVVVEVGAVAVAFAGGAGAGCEAEESCISATGRSAVMTGAVKGRSSGGWPMARSRLQRLIFSSKLKGCTVITSRARLLKRGGSCTLSCGAVSERPMGVCGSRNVACFC